MSELEFDENGNIKKEIHIRQHEFVSTLEDKNAFLKGLKRKVISALVVAGSLAMASGIVKFILEYFDKGKQ